MNLMELLSDDQGTVTVFQPKTAPASHGNPTMSLAEFIWLDGEIVPFETVESQIRFSPSPEYGIGGIEGVRCYNAERGPALFRLSDHMQRFSFVVRSLGIEDFPHTLDELGEAACRLVYANNMTECYVRPLILFEDITDTRQDVRQPITVFAAWKWDSYSNLENSKTTAPSFQPVIKQMHSFAGLIDADFSEPHVNNIVAKTMAMSTGVEAVVLFNPSGFVSGCSADNLLSVKDNVIYTTSYTAVHEGVIRNTILQLARDAGYEVIEDLITGDQLYGADEVFTCSIISEVMGVLEIDFQPIGNGQLGPVTRDLQKRYQAVVRGKDRSYLEWLDYLVLEPLI